MKVLEISNPPPLILRPATALAIASALAFGLGSKSKSKSKSKGGNKGGNKGGGGARGTVLFEVILALALFVGAAVIIGTSLQASSRSLERSRLQIHALNLATSAMAELQMGLAPWADAEPHPLPPPFDLWTCEVRITPLQADFEEADALRRVHVIVRHSLEPVVHRMVQWWPSPQPASEP
jgi:hypothetical protein